MSKDDDKNNPSENQQAKDADGQVIQFPLERLKAQRKAKRLANRNRQQKKATLFLSVASVFVLAAYFNQQTGSNLQEVVHKQGMERMVANSEISNGQIDDKNQELGEQLEDSTKRTPASYGRKPTAFEKLKLQKLKSKYHLVNNPETNLLSEIHFLENIGGEKQTPVYLRKRDKGAEDFLLENKDIISPTYSYVKFIEEERLEDGISKYYHLLSDEGLEVGRVSMKFNKYGAFIQMLVEEYRQPASE